MRLSRTAEVPSTDLVPFAPQIEQFTGEPDNVLERILEAQQTGRLVRSHPIQRLDNGQILIVTEMRPETGTVSEEIHPKRGRFASLELYLLALAAVIGLALLIVSLYLFVLGLQAVVVWGSANALTIGIYLMCGFAAVLVFMGMVAKMRHGSPGTRRY